MRKIRFCDFFEIRLFEEFFEEILEIFLKIRLFKL